MLRRDTLMNACLAGLCAVTAHAALADTSTAALAEQVSALQKKVDALEAGPLTGLAITGYVDPTYIANQDQHLGSFFFANKAAPYAYYQSTFGDVYRKRSSNSRVAYPDGVAAGNARSFCTGGWPGSKASSASTLCACGSSVNTRLRYA